MRGNRVSLKNVPTGAWIFATAALVVSFASVVILSVFGKDTSDVRWLILALLNASGTLTGIASTVYSGAAAKNAQQAVEQTNGVQATERQAIANAAALRAVALHKAEQSKG